MGLIVMSERELNSIEVLAQVGDERLSVHNGVNMLMELLFVQSKSHYL